MSNRLSGIHEFFLLCTSEGASDGDNMQFLFESTVYGVARASSQT